ncbi:hypothetical protein [Gracilibacillus dipsosauri]|uniref:hypothetical protein n=1 Tax=Gracilibacillus dipsosauri TaxID=178340 RepID=UPI00240A394F
MLLLTLRQKISGAFNVVKSRVKNEKGAELMEWIGMILVVIAILGAVITFFSDSDGGIGEKIQSFISTQIENLTNGGGGD